MNKHSKNWTELYAVLYGTISILCWGSRSLTSSVAWSPVGTLSSISYNSAKLDGGPARRLRGAGATGERAERPRRVAPWYARYDDEQSYYGEYNLLIENDKACKEFKQMSNRIE